MKKQTLGVLAILSVSTSGHAASWTGEASFYRAPHEMTCAHRSLPFGTRLRVTNLRNNRTAILTVADRGPFIRGRIVDVSIGAANVLGFRSAGVVPVRIETLYN